MSSVRRIRAMLSESCQNVLTLDTEMAMPADIDARRYYRVAYQRWDDGVALLGISRPRAAIYLSGYAVECILKALLLVSTPVGQGAAVLATDQVPPPC